MLLTQETDYALRILRSLSTESVISVQRLAEQEDLPRHFAHKIAKKLEKAGIIRIHNHLCMIQRQINQVLRSRSLLWVLGLSQE